VKTIVVGGGIMGLATAWGLAREGHAVELFEQGPLPNPMASSMDEHRLIRHPYGDHLGYARMIDQAYAAWDLLWSDLGQRLYAATGTLALTGNGETWAERSAAVLADIGKSMKQMPLDELREARAMTQVHLAKILGVNQAAVSKMERRADMYVSTLQDFVRAMGGELKITARFPEGTVEINQFEAVKKTVDD